MEAAEPPRSLQFRRPSLFEGACSLLRGGDGIDLAGLGFESASHVCEAADEDLLLYLLFASWLYLYQLDKAGERLRLSSSEFESRINKILEEDGYQRRLRNGSWKAVVDSDAEALRRALISNPSDLAACVQGDVQVEMVASTVQSRLAQADTVLVDYGVGLGRVLSGLNSAPLFARSKYIGVDEPIRDDLAALVQTLGSKPQLQTRTEFLRAPCPADVIMLVNTLHHIPFKDLPAQISRLLGALKPGGMLLIHELAELHAPEQRNVPWRVEDIQALLALEGVRLNPRTTRSKGRKIPLTNLLVEVTTPSDFEAGLVSSTERVWRQMKERTLSEVTAIYAARDPDRQLELEYALITNANLDLNRPQS
jgi:hypothetical protein